ncbi:MAG: asparagine synthase C-terminal domain-containing protein [Candidatus Verstraetearchaeota archaeon]|nr:asparagine synthase C-terminal domain-containing protein [Candidatus Verstraetearchaeota archaeon]
MTFVKHEADPKEQLIALLRRAIHYSPSDGVILSGGVDSSLVAALASQGREIVGVTAVFDRADAQDKKYSKAVAERLGIRHILREYSLEEAARAAREVIRIMRTFDHVEVRNDVTVFLAMECCREEGIDFVLTGDGGDELFAGYEFMVRMDEATLSRYIDSFTGRWFFSAPYLGSALGVRVGQPFLEREIVDFARKLPYGWRVRRQESGGAVGKWILRSALWDLGLSEIAYRRKEPIEQGSGSAMISRLLLESMGDDAEKVEAEAREEGIRFWDREQAYFYRIFREIHGIVPRPRAGEKGCLCCGAPVETCRIVCRYCGFSDKGRV